MYAEVDELKQYLSLSEAGDDALLPDLLLAAQRVVEAITGRSFEAVEETHEFGPEAIDDDGVLWLDGDLQSVTQILNGEGEELTSYVLLPRSGPPYDRIKLTDDCWCADDDAPVQVTGTWGYSTEPPADIKYATMRLAGYFYRLRDAQVYDVTAMPGAGVITVPKGIPADVEKLLRRYIAWGVR